MEVRPPTSPQTCATWRSRSEGPKHSTSSATASRRRCSSATAERSARRDSVVLHGACPPWPRPPEALAPLAACQGDGPRGAPRSSWPIPPPSTCFQCCSPSEGSGLQSLPRRRPGRAVSPATNHATVALTYWYVTRNFKNPKTEIHSLHSQAFS